MSAVSEAVARGVDAQGKNPKWEPVGVSYPGWLTALVRRVGDDEVEGIFFAQGKWQFRKLGKDGEGKVKSYDVRERELKRIVKAMIGSDEHRGDLISECYAKRSEELEEELAGITTTKKRTRRRGRKKR